MITKQPKTFVIALKDHPISLSQLNDCLLSAKAHNWEVETFWGINGRTLTLESWNSIGVKPLLHKGAMHKPGTWGCFFSHFALWNKCIELNEPIVILEHDAIIKSKWVSIEVSSALVKLHEDYSFKKDSNGWIDPGGFVDSDSGQGSVSTHAYCITPEQASKLIYFAKTVGGYATDRMIGNKILPIIHMGDPTIVARQNTYSTTEHLLMANKEIYCFWFGSSMSDDRKRCFDSMVRNSGVPVILVTESNLKDFLLPEYPLHPGFNYLSSTHKSDYLRSYFMYFHGGGYSDIKQFNHNWNTYFDELNNSDKLFCGYPEKCSEHIVYTPGAHAYKELVGNGQFIFKPQTAFAKLWYNATQQKMNEIYDRLVANPGHYHPRAVFGGAFQADGFKQSKYPLEWEDLMGKIFHKIQYENRGKCLNTLPYVNIENYR